MKNKRSVIAIFGMALAFAFGFVIPMVITVFEDNYLQSKTKNYKIEEISLHSVEGDLTEKLTVFQELLVEKIFVQKSMTEMSSDSKGVEKKAAEFLLTLREKEEVEFQKFSATSLVIADAGMDKVYSLWKCYAVDEYENKYLFWIDETTEKVLAFEIQGDVTQMDNEDYYMMAYNLTKYYGYTRGGFVENDIKFQDKEKEETAIVFYNEAAGEEFVLMFYKNGNILSFNMFPGELAVDNTSVYRY